MKSVHGTDWTRHIHGTIWICSEAHDSVSFRDVEDFKRHRIEKHPEPTDQVQFIVLEKQMCRQELRDDLVCPLCEARPSEVDDFLGLEEHIATELEYLAFATFPNVNGRDAIPKKKNGKDATAEVSVSLEGEGEDSADELDWKAGSSNEHSQTKSLTFSEGERQQGLESGTALDEYNQMWQHIKPMLDEESNFLEDRLWEAAVPHANRANPSFWPPGIWKTIVTKQAITDQILQAFPHYDPEKAEAVAGRVLQDKSGPCVRIFTILVLLSKVERLEHIMQCRHGVRDHDLPLILKKRQGGHRSELCRANSKPVCCFSHWRDETLFESFERLQRRLAVPVFRLGTNNTVIHLDLDEQDILPWCEEAEVPPIMAMSDGSETVVRVRIHPDCHEFHELLKAVCRFLSHVYALLVSDLNARSALLVVSSVSKSCG